MTSRPNDDHMPMETFHGVLPFPGSNKCGREIQRGIRMTNVTEHDQNDEREQVGT